MLSVEYQLDDTSKIGGRTGTVEGLILMYTSFHKPGETALLVEEFYASIGAEKPGLIMLLPGATGKLAADVKGVAATKDLWMGVFAADISSSLSSHYTHVIREMMDERQLFLSGRIRQPRLRGDKESVLDYIKGRELQEKFHLRYGSATVASTGLLVVQSDLDDFEHREKLIALMRTNEHEKN